MEKEDRSFVSVVMTVKNVERTIKECLESLVNLDYPKERYEIVIVDGMSTDRTKEIISGYANSYENPKIHLYEKPGSIGAGRNEALRYVKGEFIAITDGDMVVDSAWLGELMEGFEKGIAGVGGPNNNADDDPLTKCISSLDIQGPSNDIVYLSKENPYFRDFTSSSDIYATVCRNTSYRKSVLEEVGGFDESLIGAEDSELNMKILKKGYMLRYNPRAVVHHHHRVFQATEAFCSWPGFCQ
jgi:cellulose synthase/poly-beta-1,6-N-acetylglucosamine synthase-like glycosyltransferase